ncbi:MAG: lysophospholipase L1-like esterase [Candidatus Latescibacterota bacterium]|jgi:lysophospholipase L1-like esterase
MAKIVLVGSSIFQQWHSADEVFVGREVVNCAIGGTTTSQWLDLLPAVLEEEKPDAVCVYCGSNDLNAAIGEEQIVGNVLRLRLLVRAYGECVPLAFFSIIKAPQKLSKWDLIERINARVRLGLLEGDRYVETNGIFFAEKRVREELFVEDQLHLTDAAYALMVGVAEPVLADWLRA